MKKINFKLVIFFILFVFRIIFLYSYAHDWNWVLGYKALGWTTGYLLYLIYVMVMYGILATYIYQTVVDNNLKIFCIMFIIMVVYTWASFYSPTLSLPLPAIVAHILYIIYIGIMFGMLIVFFAKKIRKRK